LLRYQALRGREIKNRLRTGPILNAPAGSSENLQLVWRSFGVDTSNDCDGDRRRARAGV